jgi:peptidoglycan/LPS O-acetylase OafA/YrhL
MPIIKYYQNAFKQSFELKKIPGLDFIRAIASLFVVFCHLSDYNSTGIQSLDFFLQHSGTLAVTFFFVLSGYLISGILFRENDFHGTLFLKKFYLHRFLRISIPLIVYCLFILLLEQQKIISPSLPMSMISAVFMFRSYYTGDCSGPFGHTWSLSIEEQFYLLLPILILFVSHKKLSKILILLIASGPVIRILHYLLTPDLYKGRGELMFHTRMDSLVIGVYISYLINYFPEVFQSIRQFITGKILLLCILYLLLIEQVGYYFLKGKWMLPIGLSSISIAASLIIIYLSHMKPGTSFYKFFNNRLISHLGTLSYSIYVWQQLFTLTTFMPPTIALILTYLSALFIYLHVEYPIYLFRKRIQK